MERLLALLVDDDVKITTLLSSYFEKEGFSVLVAHDGPGALAELEAKRPDIMVLDLMLPGMDGWEVCRQARRIGDVPIIMLTARDDEVDRLVGLEMGADDYVTKPFSPREVVVRAKVILRRTQGKAAEKEKENSVRVNGLTLDRDAFRAWYAESELELTPTEFRILDLLASSPGRVYSRMQIVEQVQGYAFEGYERTIDAHIKNLRRKLAEHSGELQLIQTVYGVGYKLAGENHA
ncbi:response regulator transcription factor [Azotosporobacter soli]|uniref:response regulator transcription factor n=1 Tax=Azotosporobacter soli TaxID=3055040 RepID=UPI0031FF2B03